MADNKHIFSSDIIIDTKPKVMIVDDNDFNLVSLSQILKYKFKLSSDLAYNGQEAVNKATNQDNGYDIIFMDIGMPIMDGIEATKLILRNYNIRKKKVKIVAVTGYCDSLVEKNCLSAGMEAVYNKPMTLDKVKKILNLEDNIDYNT